MPHSVRAITLGMVLTVVGPAAGQPRRPPSTPSAPAAPAAPPAAAAPIGPATRAPRPLAQTLTGDAKSAYEAAKLLVGDGDFAGAAIKFKAAFDLSGDARLLWNIAACEKGQRHYARTMVLVRQYLDSGQDLLTDADRREAQALLNAIESFVVKLTIVVSEPGAEVFVDDEPVGRSPLGVPVVVDIGQRRVAVKKAGFKDTAQLLVVGGSADARVEVTLEPELHQSNLVVTSQPDARISIDGRIVAMGSYKGALPSGGHLLRVEADGTRPYQSEVVLSDAENRTIDVALEKVAVAPAAVASSPSLELGASGGPGVKLRGDQPWMATVRADVALRLGWVVGLGLFGEYGAINASRTCGSDAHGAFPEQPLDLSVRSSFQSCSYAKAGLLLTLHFLPARAFDPWVAFEPAGRLSFYNFAAFDPLTGTTAQQSTTLPALDVGMRLGLDWHPVGAMHAWAVGLFAALVYSPLALEDSAKNAGNDANAPSGLSHGGSDAPVQYFSTAFGLRTSLAF
jgi:hypothetical protein